MRKRVTLDPFGGQGKYRPLAVDRMRITSILLRVYLC